MLTIFRAHVLACPHAPKGRSYRRCQCPIWVEGAVEGNRVPRQSLGTTNWARATQIIQQSEALGEFTKREPVTFAMLREKFIADAKARKLADSTLSKYKVLFDQLDDFARNRGIKLVRALTVDDMRLFRESWKDGAIAASKKLERLRAVMRFAVESDWMEKSPAAILKAPKTRMAPTLPLSRDEVSRILKHCESAKEKALVLLLRHSGLRITDAATLAADRVVNGKLFLYTHKTGVAVYVPLPPEALYSLASVERRSPRYYFWTGEGKPETQAGNMRRTLRRVFKAANVPDAHPHRFRDTFAVELLLAGVPIERISTLLGHSSIKVTEKHYAPWVKSRQEQLEADVARTWGAIPDGPPKDEQTKPS